MTRYIHLELKSKYYPTDHSPESIFDFVDFERIEAEYVTYLYELVKESGCKQITLAYFSDYRGCYSSKVRANIDAHYLAKELIAGMIVDFGNELVALLEMSFRKLLSTKLIVGDGRAIVTHDVGIGATITLDCGLLPLSTLEGEYFEVDVVDEY